ncbi:MAG: DNA-binding protein [Candidatus Angelobacter sp. Gp1-AA117]|nr:MAG: DNA-binding protein [Candidatus Angelobacter sp. Gp1-AA117]
MSSELRNILRRLKPSKCQQQLKPRALSQLSFLGSSKKSSGKLLYDTTVYIDILQDRFPQESDLAVRAADAWHSPATEAEMIALCGLLDPARPETSRVIERITDAIERRPAHRTIVPDRGVWMEAAMLSGILARLQNYSSTDRRRTIIDALLFASAKKYGLTILTRNRNDFDFLQQLDPVGKVLFYERI